MCFYRLLLTPQAGRHGFESHYPLNSSGTHGARREPLSFVAGGAAAKSLPLPFPAILGRSGVMACTRDGLVRDVSELGAQPGRGCLRNSYPELDQSVGLVRARGDLCSKSSKCIQCGEPLVLVSNPPRVWLTALSRVLAKLAGIREMPLSRENSLQKGRAEMRAQRTIFSCSPK